VSRRLGIPDHVAAQHCRGNAQKQIKLKGQLQGVLGKIAQNSDGPKADHQNSSVEHEGICREPALQQHRQAEGDQRAGEDAVGVLHGFQFLQQPAPFLWITGLYSLFRHFSTDKKTEPSEFERFWNFV